jgi:hypothetical protein
MTKALLALGAAVVLTVATFAVTEADARSGGRGGGGGFRGGGFGGGGFRGGGMAFRGGGGGFYRGGGVAFRGGGGFYRGGGVAFRTGGVAWRGGGVAFRTGGVAWRGAGFYRGYRFAHRPFRRVFVGGYYPAFYGGYGYGYSCLRTVWTAYGAATVNVCDDGYGYY